MDRLQTMQIYVQIVECGNFTQAADALQLHRPAVTKAVQQLEQELGVRLLNRSTRRVSVTAEGEAFHARCVQLLASIDDAFASFPKQRAVPKGRLRIDIALALAKTIVIPALPDFQQRYPQIEVVLGASDQPLSEPPPWRAARAARQLSKYRGRSMSASNPGCVGAQPSDARVRSLVAGASIPANIANQPKCSPASAADFATTGTFSRRPITSAIARNGTPVSSTA